MAILSKLNKHFEEIILVVFFSVMIILVFLQVVFRYVFNYSLIWSEELARYLFVWQILLGASLSIRDDKHLKIDVIYMIVPEKMKKYIKVLSYFIFLVFALFLIKEGTLLVNNMLFIKKQYTPAMKVPMGLIYLIVPFSATLMSIRLVQNIVKICRN